MSASDSYVPPTPAPVKKDDKKAQNGKKAEVVVQPRKNAWPPMKKKAKVEVEEIEDEDDLEELEEYALFLLFISSPSY